MRYINTNILNIPDNWLDLAKAELGNNHASLWSYLKPEIEKVVNKKCWFSESINLGADNDIEHFRPKAARVKQLTNENADLEPSVWPQINTAARDGYSFLEFEKSNYRYACTFINSPRRGQKNKVRGKSNFFPLQTGSALGTAAANIVDEVFCLLDPCIEEDVELFAFNDIGEIQPHVSILNDSWDYCRVKVSVEVYHLHYYRFVDARKQVWDACKEFILLANELYLMTPKTPLEERTLKIYIQKIMDSTDKKSPFSAVSVDCIRYYKKTIDWLEKVFPEATLVK